MGSPAPPSGSAHPGLARGRSRRRARHAARHEHWTHALAAQPWTTLVLLAAVVVGLLGLRGDDQYAAEAVLTTPSARASSEAVVLLTSPALVDEVEQAVELAPALQGEVFLEVAEHAERGKVVLRATAPDPRLAALAADTALSLLVHTHPEEGYELSVPAAVPTHPVRSRALWWAWATPVALAAAIWMERHHGRWLPAHPVKVAGEAR